jgi:hypothetical protein
VKDMLKSAVLMIGVAVVVGITLRVILQGV